MVVQRYPRRNPEAAFRPMGEEGGLVVLPTRREVKVLNEVGIRVYALLDGSRSERQIAEVVAEEFEVALDEAARDVAAFLAELRRDGMLLEDGAPAVAEGEAG
jgi:hypothetical protein